MKTFHKRKEFEIDRAFYLRKIITRASFSNSPGKTINRFQWQREFGDIFNHNGFRKLQDNYAYVAVARSESNRNYLPFCFVSKLRSHGLPETRA